MQENLEEVAWRKLERLKVCKSHVIKQSFTKKSYSIRIFKKNLILIEFMTIIITNKIVNINNHKFDRYTRQEFRFWNFKKFRTSEPKVLSIKTYSRLLFPVSSTL